VQLEGVTRTADLVSVEARLDGVENGHSATTNPNESGRVAFEEIPPGTYTLTVERDGYEPVALDDVVVGPGDDTFLGTITLVPSRRSGSITGIARREGLGPDGHADIRVEVVGEDREPVLTATDGRWSMTLPARSDPLELRFVAMGYDSGTLVVPRVVEDESL
jgi:hypothetical protein